MQIFKRLIAWLRGRPIDPPPEAPPPRDNRPWQERVEEIERGSSPVSSIAHQNRDESSSTPAWRPPDLRIAEAMIMRALRISGVSHGQQCDAQFVLNAIGHLPWFNGLDIRRYGDKLPKERLREIGVRANSIVTQQYMDILNEQGVKDPVGAAESIAYVVRVGLDWLATIRPWEDHEPDRMMSIRPSEMAVGPCPAAIEAAEEPIPRKSAKPLPLEACIHPAQCGCRYLFYAPERAETPMTEEEQALFDELMGSIRITISGPYTRSRSDYKSE